MDGAGFILILIVAFMVYCATGLFKSLRRIFGDSAHKYSRPVNIKIEKKEVEAPYIELTETKIEGNKVTINKIKKSL